MKVSFSLVDLVVSNVAESVEFYRQLGIDAAGMVREEVPPVSVYSRRTGPKGHDDREALKLCPFKQPEPGQTATARGVTQTIQTATTWGS